MLEIYVVSHTTDGIVAAFHTLLEAEGRVEAEHPNDNAYTITPTTMRSRPIDPNWRSGTDFRFDVTITVPLAIANAVDEAAARAVILKAINDTLFNKSEGCSDDLATGDSPNVEIELIEPDGPQPTSQEPATDDELRKAAINKYGKEGAIEIDDDAIISRGDEKGAYVAAWVWVEFTDVQGQQ